MTYVTTPLPRPAIIAVNILERHRREDRGADLLVQVTLQTGDVHWLVVRKADATLTATRTVEGHGRRLVTVPARRTLKAGLADLLTEWPEILRESKADAINDHWELYRDEFDRRERRSRLEREWRVHELALVDAEDRTRRQTVRLARLSPAQAPPPTATTPPSSSLNSGQGSTAGSAAALSVRVTPLTWRSMSSA